MQVRIMKQETIDILKKIAEAQYTKKREENPDYENGYYDGAMDAQICLARAILELEEIEEITS